ELVACDLDEWDAPDRGELADLVEDRGRATRGGHHHAGDRSAGPQELAHGVQAHDEATCAGAHASSATAVRAYQRGPSGRSSTTTSASSSRSRTASAVAKSRSSRARWRCSSSTATSGASLRSRSAAVASV